MRKQKKVIGDREESVIDNLLQNTKAQPVQQKIAIPNREGYDFIPVAEIIYCRASGAYTEIILKNNKKLLLSRSLGETEVMLPAELFERVHHSLLVNIQHIDHLKKTAGTFIIMNNGDELNVSQIQKGPVIGETGY
ncbi:MAG: LytTR family transcriptional regulator DNA-binding domain-containing protein [Bacteroidota bacterium]